MASGQAQGRVRHLPPPRKSRLRLPEKAAEDVRAIFAWAQPYAVFERVERHALKAVMGEKGNERLAVEMMQVLVRQKHAPGPEPCFARIAQLAVAAIGNGN